jgi:hypothetical protein
MPNTISATVLEFTGEHTPEGFRYMRVRTADDRTLELPETGWGNHPRVLKAEPIPRPQPTPWTRPLKVGSRVVVTEDGPFPWVSKALDD